MRSSWLMEWKYIASPFELIGLRLFSGVLLRDKGTEAVE